MASRAVYFSGMEAAWIGQPTVLRVNWVELILELRKLAVGWEGAGLDSWTVYANNELPHFSRSFLHCQSDHGETFIIIFLWELSNYTM
jgi:hypothetical protein